MAKKLPAPRRKVRTREHEVGDLGVNHVKRQVLLAGFTLERIAHDYGIDYLVFTYNQSREVEVGEIRVQVKATQELKRGRGLTTFPFRLERTDLVSWLSEAMPVILVVYEVRGDVAYWLYVQAYFARLPSFNLFQIGKTFTVQLPLSNVLDPASVRKFAEFRDRIKRQFPGDLCHEE